MFLCQSIRDLVSSLDDPRFPGTRGIFCGCSVSRIVSMTRRLPFVSQDKLVLGIMFLTGLNQEHFGKLGKRHRWLTAFPLCISTTCRPTCSSQTHYSLCLDCDYPLIPRFWALSGPGAIPSMTCSGSFIFPVMQGWLSIPRPVSFCLIRRITIDTFGTESIRPQPAIGPQEAT
jgi:hypothetical protein